MNFLDIIFRFSFANLMVVNLINVMFAGFYNERGKGKDIKRSLKLISFTFYYGGFAFLAEYLHQFEKLMDFSFKKRIARCTGQS